MSNETTDGRTPYLLPDSPNGYWRTWCIECGEAIRVQPTHVHGALCQDCASTSREPPVATRTPRQVIGCTKLSLEDYIESHVVPRDM